MTPEDDFSALDGPEVAVDESTTVWDEPTRRAIDEHKACTRYWDRLAQHDKWRHDHMITKHSYHAHIRDEPGRGRLDYIG